MKTKFQNPLNPYFKTIMPFRTLLEKDFIGRSQELEVLQSICSQAKKGIATGIFLSGQHGIGKTELLSQLFNFFFLKQDEVAPFFYTVNSALISTQDFSMDYISRFILQRIAFQKKDASLVHAHGLSIENLMDLAKRSDAPWAVELIRQNLQTKTAGDSVKLFLSAISAPYLSYLTTGTPVIAIIDEFQRIREPHGPNSENNKNLWMLFEESIKSRVTPHIITGSQMELQEMLFEKTSLGESLELVNLSGLDRDVSLRLFNSLCESYNIIVEKDSLLPFVELFKGNPFYIRNFIQALQRQGKTFSENDLWKIYLSEITIGKFYTYWVSRLRTYIPQLNLKRASLELLYHLSGHSPSTLSNLVSVPSVSREILEDILNSFHVAGIMETNFSIFKLVEDEVLTDFIKALYSKEILEEPLSKIEDTFIKERYKRVKAAESPLFELTIPTTQRAELIAVRALEQFAKNQNISPEDTGHLQIALIDLFTSIITQNKHGNGNLYLRFESREDTFLIEVKTPCKELVFPASESIPEEQLIRRYIDDIKFEKTKSGTKITLVKNLKPS